MERNNSAMKHFSPDAEFKHHLNSAFIYSNNLLEKLIGIVLESDYFDDLVTLILESNADMANNDLGKTLMDDNVISYMHKVADVVPRSEVEKENTSYQMKTRSINEKPDLPKQILPKLDAEKEENGYVNGALSQIGKQDLTKWKSEVEKENTSYQMKTQSMREKPVLPRRILPKLNAEKEENGYVNGTLSQIGKQDLHKWKSEVEKENTSYQMKTQSMREKPDLPKRILPKLDAAKEENGYVNGTLNQIGKQDLPKWKSEVEKENTSYQMKTQSMREKPDLPKQMLPKLDAEKEENGYLNETLSQTGKQDLPKWILPKLDAEKEEYGYVKEVLSQVGKQDKWISTKTEVGKEERLSSKRNPDFSKSFTNETCNSIIRPSTNFSPSMTANNDSRKNNLSQIGNQNISNWISTKSKVEKEERLSLRENPDLPKWMSPKLDAEKEEYGYVTETLSQIGKQDLSKWISTKSEVKKEEKLSFKGYPDFSKSFTHDASNTIIRPNTKFSPSMTDINDVRKQSLSQIGKQELSNWISTKSEIEKEERQSLKGSPDLSKYFTPEACNTIIKPSTKFIPSMTDINDLKKNSSHKAINPNSKFTSSSEVPEHKNDQEHITHKFMQLPKARQELINSYKPNMDKAMESGTNLIRSKTNYHREQVGKVLDSGTEMLKKYKEPVDKVIESGSNIINSYKPPVNKVLESSSFMINSYKESGSNMINSYKESGSNIIKQPVKQVLESSSNVLSSKVTSIANSVMNVPAIGKYMPWLIDYGDQEEEE